MAAAQSHYSSTQETTNGNRVYRILLGPCTDQLRDVLRKKIPPSTFAAAIDRYRYKLKLTPTQRELILPEIGSYNGNYDDFDISLLYILLRNICQIPAHKNGWGKDPDVNDLSLSANIEKVRVTRNNTVHSGQSSLTNTEFSDICTSLKSAVVSMDAYLLNQNYYEKEIENLRITTMDPVQDKHYRDQLAKQYSADQDTKECVRLLQESQKRFEKKMEEYSQQQRKFKTEVKENLYKRLATSIPENMRDQHKRILHSWKTDVFFETSSFPEILAFFISHQIVAVIGSPGSGKTALIRHIALALESKYQIVPITKPEDIITYGDLHKEQIFVIDDVLGVFTLEREALSYLERQRKRIENILEMKTKRSKLFMSCRLAVYKEAKKMHVDFFEDDNILNLESEENNLTVDDRKGILEAHLKNAGISCKIDQKILHRKDVFMFPLLCQMFSSDKSIRGYGTEFFTCPSKCLLSEIGRIEKRNNLQYLSMVLCMLNRNSLSEEIFSNAKMLDKVFRSCKVKGSPKDWEIFEHLSHLKGTYVTGSDKKYTFIHDSVFEVVAYHYGQKFPDQILDYMSSNFIANRVVLETMETREDLCIKINKSQYQNLARRLYVDVKEGKLHDVFLNKVLKDCAFELQFKNILSESPFEDVKECFFIPRKEGIDSVMNGSRRETKKEEAEEEALEQKELDRQVLLLGLKCFGPHDIYKIRAISFIIYYGHFGLLKYLIKLVVKNSQSIDLILGSSEEEQTRLLVLACYNGNLDMVIFLIEKLGKRFINKMPVGEVDIMYNRHRFITPVIAACLRMRYDVMRYLLKNGGNLNPGNSFYPALWTPARTGDLNTLMELLEYGADCNKCNGRGMSPLHAGSYFGYLAVVEKLIDNGAEINRSDFRDFTSLHFASQNGHLSVVKMLICKGAEYNRGNKNGSTPFHLASQKGHILIVKELMELGVDVNKCDFHGRSPLYLASSEGHLFVVKHFVKHGANINICDNHRQSPLHLASKHGHLPVVETLIQNGAECDRCDKNYLTPLHRASQEGHLFVVQKLIHYRVDIDKCDVQGRSPLYLASWKGHLPVVKKLIEHKSDMNKCDIFGLSPLHLAAQNGHLAVLETLLYHGAKCNQCNQENISPLHLASTEGHVHVVEKLVEYGADINKCDIDGLSSLHYALIVGHLPVVEMLIKHGININMCNTDGQSALHFASKNGQLSVVETLIHHGAECNRCDKNKLTPLHFAVQEKFLAVAEKLIENGADKCICDFCNPSSLHLSSPFGNQPVEEALIEDDVDYYLHDENDHISTISLSRGCCLCCRKNPEQSTDVNKL